jgi:hypothetical protein
MVMLSELMRFQVTDSRGDSARLTDMVIGKLDTDYPLVTHLIYRQNREAERMLPWSKVKRIDQAEQQIRVERYHGAKEIDTLGQAVRLQRDVLDALILDLQNRRTTRAHIFRILYWNRFRGRALVLDAQCAGHPVAGSCAGTEWRAAAHYVDIYSAVDQ